ncbi:MAG: response regulator [Bacteroidales bacterium]
MTPTRSPETPRRVLVVDDDQQCREMYARFLTESGFEVEQAHNGNQALAKATEQAPSLVVTDLALPGLDGFALTRQLRQHPRTASLPIIAITGYGGFVDDTARAVSAGCDLVLTKPCLPTRLLEEVERLLARTPA